MRELLEVLRSRGANDARRLAFDDGSTLLDYAFLAGRVAAIAEELQSLKPAPAVVGILAGNRVEGVIGQLAVWLAGKLAVPLPPFFPVLQLQRIVKDAGIAHLLVAPAELETVRQLGVPATVVGDRVADWKPPATDGAGQIVYTSGTTGHPKGVLLESDQALWSGRALATAIDASRDDVYLSVLPLATLLETISAIVIPILVGARVRLEPKFGESFGDIGGGDLALAIGQLRPTCMVLVPQLLANWVRRLDHDVVGVPDSLRFVAVGGAPLASTLAEKAWRRGIPVYEGYGLSECGSVVALNRPSERKPGTVGKPLPGLDVYILGDEVIVRGTSIMDRYLHGKLAGVTWRTGDVGEIDADGFLKICGRRDNVIVTATGRNISPEWIEALIAADPRVQCALVTHTGSTQLDVLLVPSLRGRRWFERANHHEIAELIASCCADVPYYAVPRRAGVVSAEQMVSLGLLDGSGRVLRRAARERCGELLAYRQIADIERAGSTGETV